jgi:hypothetical protein
MLASRSRRRPEAHRDRDTRTKKGTRRVADHLIDLIDPRQSPIRPGQYREETPMPEMPEMPEMPTPAALVDPMRGGGARLIGGPAPWARARRLAVLAAGAEIALLLLGPAPAPSVARADVDVLGPKPAPTEGPAPAEKPVSPAASAPTSVPDSKPAPDPRLAPDPRP